MHNLFLFSDQGSKILYKIFKSFEPNLRSDDIFSNFFVEVLTLVPAGTKSPQWVQKGIQPSTEQINSNVERNVEQYCIV